MYAINTIDGTRKWIYHTLTGYFVDSSPAVNGNFIYVGSSDSSVYGIEDVGEKGKGSLDQSFFGNGACEINCVAKVNKTARRNVTLWNLIGHGSRRESSRGVELVVGVVIGWCFVMSL